MIVRLRLLLARLRALVTPWAQDLWQDVRCRAVDAERSVVLRGRCTPASVADLNDWRDQSRTFAGIAGYSFDALDLSDDGAPPEQVDGARVTANHFAVLRQKPVLGRDVVPADERRGADPVVIIGHDLWKNRYATAPDIIGRRVRINGRAATAFVFSWPLAHAPDQARRAADHGATPPGLPSDRCSERRSPRSWAGTSG